MQQNNIVYVVDPDTESSEALKASLESHEVSVRMYADSETAIGTDIRKDHDRSCLMVDVDLPGLNGILLLRWLREQGFGLPIAVLSNVFAYKPDRKLQGESLSGWF